jgi:hypothetical protein
MFHTHTKQQATVTLHTDRYTFWSYLAQFFLGWEMFQTKVVLKIQGTLKSDNNNRHFTQRPIYILIITRLFLLITRNVLGKLVKNMKTHILCSVTFVRKSCRFLDNVGKVTAKPDRPQVTIHAQRMHRAAGRFARPDKYVKNTDVFNTLNTS